MEPTQRPNGDGLSRDSLVISRPRSFGAESFRMIRANLAFVLGSRRGVSLLVTSAGPSEGKSLVSSNLAASLCEHGARVVLVDADLRRGRLARVFGTRQSPGLSNLLAGALGAQEPEFGQALSGGSRDGGQGDGQGDGVLAPVKWPADSHGGSSIKGSLRLLPAGPYPPNSGQLVGSPAMGRIIATLKAAYDYVIVDTTPVLSVADAVLLAKQVDGVILVVRLGIGNREAVVRAKATLAAAEANVLGTVINGVGSPGGYGYAYYYKGYYDAKG